MIRTGIQRGAPVVETAWGRFVDFLRRRGDRATQARRFVVEAALTRDDHFQADEVAAGLARGARRVSRGTVYRTLALMVEAGLLRRLHDHGATMRYERALDLPDHHHIVCTRCGRQVEFADPALLERLDRLCAQHGFGPRRQLMVFAQCNRCNEGRTKQPTGTS